MVQKNLCLVVILLLQITGIWSANARNDSLIQSRVGFTNSKFAFDIKYLATLRKRDGEKVSRGNGMYCGATLISDSVVLTSAHCLLETEVTYKKPEDFVVVIGSMDTQANDEETLDFNIKSFKVGHYNEKSHDNDIALLFLDGKVPANHQYIQPVTLNDGPLTDNAECQAYGWGNSPNGQYYRYANVIDIPIRTSKSCQQNTPHGLNVHSTMICAGMQDGDYYYYDTCYGDKGGPVSCNGKQIGIISWSNDCGESKLPTVLTDVSKYKSWIIKHVALHSATLPSFGKV